MKLLLDTHIWLWSLLVPTKLTPAVATRLESPENELWLSPITTWEALVLIEKGRVEVDGDPIRWISDALRAMPFHEAALTHEVAVESRRLELPHHDPADRFLAASAKVYELTLVTADERLLGSGEFSVLANR
ncbi:MAG: type II toxin-antitoxin system VapC family toxin [Gemmatimonadales bacterium]|nr:type II toxin-antitoxin system VapC family toxin [Gemmatimonadales bacterium]